MKSSMWLRQRPISTGRRARSRPRRPQPHGCAARASGEAWAAIGHPVAPDKLALAVGSSGSTFTDHGMRWDNSGKNGHYAPISWSN
jgi:hypothetical protein